MNLLHPLGKNFFITQYFMENPEYYGKFGLPGHDGVDFSVAEGTPVRAAASGTMMSLSGKNYGNYAVIESYDKGVKFATLYAHLSVVNPKGWVERGQVIGLTGNTGNSTGPHLHFGYFIEDKDGKRTMKDPLTAIVYIDTVEEKLMQSKFSFHFQLPQITKPLINQVLQSGVRAVKIMNPDHIMAEPFGKDMVYIGRLYAEDNWDAEVYREGKAGAQKWCDAMLPRIARCPWVDIWEDINEPVLLNEENCKQWVEFTLAKNNILRPRGIFSSCGQFSVGNPPNQDMWNILSNVFPTTRSFEYDLKKIKDNNDDDYWVDGFSTMLMVHEYADSRFFTIDGYKLGRVAVAMDIVRDNHRAVPTVCVTEFGHDIGGDGYTDGWKRHMTAKEFILGCDKYDDYAMQLPYIQLVTPFTSTAANDWQSFALDGDFIDEFYLPWLQDKNADFDTMLCEYAQTFIIPQNEDAAFYKYAREHGWELISPEFRYLDVVGQVGYAEDDSTGIGYQHVMYAKEGEWDKIHVITHKN